MEIDTKEIDQLVTAAWAHYRQLAPEPFVVTSAIPILYFGDAERYLRSSIKVITVGLNPSSAEFPPADRFVWFPEGAALQTDILTAAQRQLLLQALNGYFQRRPYSRWFNPSFEKLLNGLESSYYADYPNTALHTDICSPLATDPTWSGLDPAQRALLEPEGRRLWHHLVEYLLPDVILISVARAHLGKIQFPAVGSWQTLYSSDLRSDGTPRRRYIVAARPVAVAGQKNALLVFGQAANTPFGTVSASDKVAIGRAIRGQLDGR